MSSRLPALFSIPLALFVVSCTDSSTGQRAQNIAGGTADAIDTNIVSIVMTGGGNGSAVCSGSLIAPNLVLTARHCVSFVPEEPVWCQQFTDTDGAVRETTITMDPYPAGSFLVTTNPSLRRPRDAGGAPVAHFVNRVIIPADSTGVTLCGRDIALLELADNVPAAEATPLVPRLDLPPVPGEIYTAIGYGGTDDNGTGVGTRRILENLSVIDVGQFVSGPPLHVKVQAEEEWHGDHGVCGGDSGGPALSSHHEVIGSVSRGSTGCDMPVYTRVDSFAALIRQSAAMAAVDGNYSSPFWVVPNTPGSVPVGSPCLTDADCASAFDQCLFPSTGAPRRLCLPVDCTQCPMGYTCGTTDSMQACLPPMQPADAGVFADAGIDGAAHPDASTVTAPLIVLAGGCDVRSGRSRNGAPLGAFGFLVVAIAQSARRRRRGSSKLSHWSTLAPCHEEQRTAHRQ